MSEAESYEVTSWPGESASLFSAPPAEIAPPSAASQSPGEISALAAPLADHLGQEISPALGDITEDADALAFEHVEKFNLMCVGESGLGKSTFLRNIFDHLEPSKLHEMRRLVAAQVEFVKSLEDKIARNEHEVRQ